MKSCCKDAFDNQEPQNPKDRKAGAGKWFKRIGIAGFIFFLVKGLLWLAVIYGGMRISGCQ